MKHLLTFVFLFPLLVTPVSAQSTSADTVVASHHFKKGIAFLAAQHYDSALTHFQHALPDYEASDDMLKIIVCLNKIAESQFGASDYRGAEMSAQKVLKLCAENFSSTHVQTGYACTVLGNVALYSKNDLSAAMAFYQRALETFKKNYGEVHPDVAKAYMAIGHTNAYFLGRYSMMIEYYTKALNIFLKVRDKNHPDIAGVYSSLGLAYKEIEQYDTAEEFLEKALAIFKATMGEQNLAVANCLGNIARIQRARKQYAKAIHYFERVKRIHQDVYHERHPFVIMVYRGIGDVYADMGNVALAEKNYKRGIEIAQTVFSQKHPVIAAIYNDLSELFQAHQDFRKALDYAQKAIIANVFDFNEADPSVNPKANTYYWEIREFIYALANKERIFLELHNKNRNIEYLRNGFSTLEINDQVIDEFGKYFQDHDDKVFRGAEAVTLVYETGIAICIALFEATHDKQYLEKAFYFSEKSKAGILMDAISELKAKHTSHIPSNLLDFEKKLKDDRSRYHAQIQQEKSKGERADEKVIATVSDKLFTVSRKYDSLIHLFEKQYPQYYSLKFQNKIISVQEIQQQLDKRAAVLEYFIGKTVAYQFLITKDNFQYHTLDGAAFLQAHISNLRKAVDPLNKDTGPTFKNYAYEAHFLFNYFLKDILARAGSCEDLIIVPDQTLTYVPFDIFLTEPVNKPADYKNLPYLLNRYSISYAYSASTLYNKPEKKASNTSSQLIAFAPEYKPIDDDSVLIARAGNFRSKLTTLTWNQQEALGIGAMMDGVALVGKNAVERKFKETAASYNIIHLAMHALIDDEQPLYSRLAFSAEPDTMEDNFLNAYELYNMELPAALVVLSACETGYGKFESGEGIVSIAHAFAVAGCPSIVMSHWVADDKATAEIMRLFYGNLADGLDKAQALRKAKLDFLKAADDIRKNPGLWSSFVVLGDRSPITHASIITNVWFYVVAVFIAGLFFLWLRYRRRAKSR